MKSIVTSLQLQPCSVRAAAAELSSCRMPRACRDGSWNGSTDTPTGSCKQGSRTAASACASVAGVHMQPCTEAVAGISPPTCTMNPAHRSSKSSPRRQQKLEVGDEGSVVAELWRRALMATLTKERTAVELGSICGSSRSPSSAPVPVPRAWPSGSGSVRPSSASVPRGADPLVSTRTRIITCASA